MPSVTIRWCHNGVKQEEVVTQESGETTADFIERVSATARRVLNAKPPTNDC